MPLPSSSNLSEVCTEPFAVTAVLGRSNSSEDPLLRGESSEGSEGTAGTMSDPRALRFLRSFLDSSTNFGLDIDKLRILRFPSCAVVGVESLSTGVSCR